MKFLPAESLYMHYVRIDQISVSQVSYQLTPAAKNTVGQPTERAT